MNPDLDRQLFESIVYWQDNPQHACNGTLPGQTCIEKRVARKALWLVLTLCCLGTQQWAPHAGYQPEMPAETLRIRAGMHALISVT